MITSGESSRLRQEFWTTFGRYMNPVPSAEGLKINWINYHTGVKDLYFRMDAGSKSSMISISLEHADPGVRELYFMQFLELKKMLREALREEWEWKRNVALDNSKQVDRIYRTLQGVSVFNREQWPELISFFKSRLITLDRFWENARYGFEGLR